MKSMVKVLVLGGAAAVLAGCASKGEPIKPQTINLVSEERVFEFPAETVAGEAVTDAMITEGLIASMYDASHYGVMNIDNVSRPSDAGYWQYVAVEEEQGGLELTYANNYYYPTANHEETTSIDALYQVDIRDQGDTKQVTFTTPATIHLTPAQSASTFSAHIPPALSMENAQQDVLQINSMTPAIEQVHTVEGDVDVSWGVSAVKANFDRIFKAAAGGKDGSVKYLVPMGSEEQEVNLEVFPYREGSKVEYQFKVAYELRGDGTSTYPEDKVAGIIQKIEDAAKD